MDGVFSDGFDKEGWRGRACGNFYIYLFPFALLFVILDAFSQGVFKLIV